MLAAFYYWIWLAQTILCAPIDSRTTGVSTANQADPGRPCTKCIVDNFNNIGFSPVAKLILGGQVVEAAYDTGSDAVWFPQPGSSTVKFENNQCTYLPAKSKSAASVWSVFKFSVSYADGSMAAGGYWQDTLLIGTNKNGQIASTTAAVVKLFPFALATKCTMSEGVIGLGTSKTGLVATLFTRGLTGSNAFGFHMNSQRGTSSGQVVFGGVDRNRFTGPLRLYKAQKSFVNDFMEVPLQGMTVNGKALPFTKSSLALLDTGAGKIILPVSFKSQFQLQLKGDFYYGACDGSGLRNLSFNFGTLSITVPLEMLYLDPNHAKTGMCEFMISFMDDEFILGIPFLRAAYVYYDNANYRIGIAQLAGATLQTQENLAALSPRQADGFAVLLGTGKA